MPKLSKEVSARQVDLWARGKDFEKPENAKKKEISYAVGGVGKLFLRVRRATNGDFCSLWLLRFSNPDFRPSLGAYPSLSLAQAREKAREILKAVAEGKDPRDVMRPPKNAKESITFGEAFEEFAKWYISTSKGKTEGLSKNCKAVRNHLSGLLGYRVQTMKTADIAPYICPVWQEQAETYRKIKGTLGAFFKWCALNAGYRESPENIAKAEYLENFLGKLAKSIENHPFVKPNKVPYLFKSLIERGQVSDLAVIFGILNALRMGNILAVRWAQIVDYEDEGITYKVIHYKPEEMKVSRNGQHIVPLARQALEILEVMRVLDSVDPRAKFTDNVFIGESEGYLFSDSTLGNAVKASHKRELMAGREGWKDPKTGRVAVPHGLARASFETWARENEIDKRIIGLAQHHEVAEYKGAYDRATNMKEKADCLQKWADFTCSLIEEDLKRLVQEKRSIIERLTKK